MKILTTAAEVAPFAKVGGLADMTAALPIAWQRDGHEVAIILPRYATIDAEAASMVDTGMLVPVPMGSWMEYARVYRGHLPDEPEVPIYFIASADYYERPGIYGYHEGFEDNDRRFIFLSRATFEVARALDFRPDIVHAHDYHTAPVMPMLQIHYRHDPFFARTAGVFTIHNMAYQGAYDPHRAMDFCGFDPASFHHDSWFEQDGAFNAMKAGIMFADKVTTVSPTYAQEIRWTPEGMGLQAALQRRGPDLVGVLNGIDPAVWHPEHDAYLPVPYDIETLDKKEVNKKALLRQFNITDDLDLPLVGLVTRLTEQKGISLLMEALEPFVARRQCRIVLLGSGERRFEDYFRDLAARYPQHVMLEMGYNTELAHRIQGASDYYLMPSRFEPCGLTQMFALTYGAIPIVRATGGLADTVQQYDPIAFTGNGFRFDRYTSTDCSAALEAALRLYRREPHWSAIRRNAMLSDFSIAAVARRYVEVFGWAQERVRRLG